MHAGHEDGAFLVHAGQFGIQLDYFGGLRGAASLHHVNVQLTEHLGRGEFAQIIGVASVEGSLQAHELNLGLAYEGFGVETAGHLHGGGVAANSRIGGVDRSLSRTDSRRLAEQATGGVAVLAEHVVLALLAAVEGVTQVASKRCATAGSLCLLLLLQALAEHAEGEDGQAGQQEHQQEDAGTFTQAEGRGQGAEAQAGGQPTQQAHAEARAAAVAGLVGSLLLTIVGHGVVLLSRRSTLNGAVLAADTAAATDPGGFGAVGNEHDRTGQHDHQHHQEFFHVSSSVQANVWLATGKLGKTGNGCPPGGRGLGQAFATIYRASSRIDHPTYTKTRCVT